MAAVRRSLDPGTAIARYRVVSLLGAGGIAGEYDALSASSGSGTATSAIGTVTAPRSRLLPVAAVVLELAGVGFGAWQWWIGRAASSSPPASSLQVTRVADVFEVITGIGEGPSTLRQAQGRLSC